MRDPVLYRIRYMSTTVGAWCIYPMYDFAHPIQDALEGITHSLCSLEYEDHRPLYDWVVDNMSVPCRPRQIEFARLGINYTVICKREPPRRGGLRLRLGRSAYADAVRSAPPRLHAASIRNFCERIGVSKVASTVDYGFQKLCLREDLNLHAQRAMAVLRPCEAAHHKLSRGSERDVRRRKQSRG